MERVIHSLSSMLRPFSYRGNHRCLSGSLGALPHNGNYAARMSYLPAHYAADELIAASAE